MEPDKWKLAAIRCGLYCAVLDVSTPEKWEEEQSKAACELLDKAEAAITALEDVPIHRLDETPEAFIERFKVWYRETRNPALTKAGSAK